MCGLTEIENSILNSYWTPISYKRLDNRADENKTEYFYSNSIDEITISESDRREAVIINCFRIFVRLFKQGRCKL